MPCRPGRGRSPFRCGHGEWSPSRRGGDCQAQWRRRASSERTLRAGLSLATGSRQGVLGVIATTTRRTPCRPVPAISNRLSKAYRGSPASSRNGWAQPNGQLAESGRRLDRLATMKRRGSRRTLKRPKSRRLVEEPKGLRGHNPTLGFPVPPKTGPPLT